ncbi:MAG: lipid II flippase MurJ [Candidatus Accumulibacter sp.]|uniref:lipid II flippase MurJ n=1 Tax=Accumulibacter sp. TaxID=2053492 RepID=UPI00287B355B|nr:lipid II flippase MurJ [Accumulibacter sp.]MDS4014320.1 lipid II flippase MurJ [Accumulibacter sp.]
MNRFAYRFPSAGLFWSLAFVYASFMALLMQKVVLPLIPEMHAGHGLLPNDAIVFHNIAVEMAGKIHAEGWGAWKLFPGAAGNVGVLAAVYAIFGPDPAWFIPLNAAAHAAGALLIFRLGRRLWPGDVGALGGVMAGIAFLVFPSALQWYGQNHKDAFAIAGTLLVLDAWLDLHIEGRTTVGQFLRNAFQVVGGMSLLGVVRPYFPVVLVSALLASYAVVLVSYLFSRSSLAIKKPLLYRLLVVGVAAGVAFACTRIEVAAGVYGEGDSPLNIQLAAVDWTWQPSDGLPSAADKLLKRASELRAHFVAFGRSVGAGSEVDGDRLPNNALSSIAYMPRALMIGLLAPFPDAWTERVSVPRLIGAVETAIWYLFALGLAITLWKRPSRQLLAGLVFCATLLVVLAYIHPNVGTLYRQRFGVWQFVLLCGALGWASLLLSLLRGSRCVSPQGVAEGGATRDAPERTSQMDTLAASGAVVMLITLVCYLGFLTRDLLLVKQLRMGADLDAFFTAAMIPMFFVTCLAMPLADAMTSPFLSFGRDGQEKRRAEFVRRLLGFAAAILGAVAVLVVLAAPYVVGVVLGETESETAVSAAGMLRWFAPIILLSAWTVIGNAALNALRHSRDAALGQLVVPVATISALLAAPAAAASYAAIAGMLAGTLLNAGWVFYRLLPHGIRLLLAPPAADLLRPATASYRRLFLAASLTAALVPLNYAFAASVVSGGLSAWALANKIVVLFTGLASVGASAVVLPYLARMLAQGVGVRDDAHFLLVAGSWIGGLIAVGALLFADPLVAAALSDSVTSSQLSDLSGIVKIGVLQLPIAIAGALVAKMAIVSGASSRVLFAAALGFACNLSVNLLLVPHLGVLGVAVGALVATALSTLVLMLAARAKIGLTLREIVTLLVGWLVWAGTGVAAGSQSVAAVACAVLAVGGLAWAQFRNWADLRD